MKNYTFKDISASSLEELSKYHEKISEHALILSEGNQMVADEGVQNMYLNMDRYFKNNPDSVVTEQLVSMSLRNCIRNIWKVENRSQAIEHYQEEKYYTPTDFDEVEDNRYEEILDTLPSELKNKLFLYSRYKTKDIAEMEGKTIQQVRDEKRAFKEEVLCLYQNKQ